MAFKGDFEPESKKETKSEAKKKEKEAKSEPKALAKGGNEAAEVLKAKGNDLLAVGKLDEAIAAYSAAISLDALNAIYFANRSSAYIRQVLFSLPPPNRTLVTPEALSQESYGDAIRDAETAIAIDPDYVKVRNA